MLKQHNFLASRPFLTQKWNFLVKCGSFIRSKMGACQSAPTAVETPAALPITKDKNIEEMLVAANLQLAEFNRLAHAELIEALSYSKVVDEAFARWHHDIQLRKFALERGTDMVKFERALTLRRAAEAARIQNKIASFWVATAVAMVLS